MTTKDLSKALPEIVTEQVPGPKSKELLDRRNAAIPQALCGNTYPICIKQGAGAMFEDLDGNKILDWVGGWCVKYWLFKSGSNRCSQSTGR